MKKEIQLLGFTIVTLLFVSLFIGCLSEKKAEKEQAEYLESLPEDWKIYENKKWGFRLGYPPEWEITDEFVAKNVSGMGFDRFYLCFGDGQAPTLTVRVDLLNESNVDERKREVESFCSLPRMKEHKEVVVDGVPAKQVIEKGEIQISPEITRKVGRVITFAFHKDKLYKIWFDYYPLSTRENGYKVLNTFKFIQE